MATVEEICGQLRENHGFRRFYMKLINRQTNAAAALVRREMNIAGLLEAGDEETGIKDPKGIAAQVVSAIAKGKEPPKECPANIVKQLDRHIRLMMMALEPVENELESFKCDAALLAKQLPVHAWQKSVKGFGEFGLACIVGVTGNIYGYPNPDKLKKRLGLANYEGRAMSTWRVKGGLTADDWKTLKYDPKARAVLEGFIMPSMSKAQIFSAANAKNETGERQPKGPYGKIWIDYNVRDKSAHPDLTPKHLQMRANRHMLQKLVIDLWCAWHEKPLTVRA